ncbi:unnamed protein product [Closterium sp. NIES-53]
MHPTELTINFIESRWVSTRPTNLRSITSATGAVVPHLFEGCALPQLPTFTASLTAAGSSAIEETAAVATSRGQRRRKGGKKGGKGGGGGGGARVSGEANTKSSARVADPAGGGAVLGAW